MNIKVVYYSETGNTKKIADAIAEVFGINSETITDSMRIKDVDVLFAGGFLKAFTLVSPTKKLFKSLNSGSQTKSIAVFSTSASGKGILKYAKKFIKTSDILIFDEDFKCVGSYKQPDSGHPSELDCENAKDFAKKITEAYALRCK